MLIIRHEGSGALIEVADNCPVPPGYLRIPEAVRVETEKATRCPECGHYHTSECRMCGPDDEDDEDGEDDPRV